MKSTKVAIVGLGTVGTGLAHILLRHGDRIARRAGKNVELARVVVRDLAKPRDNDVPNEIVTDQLGVVLDDPEVKVVAQLVGGVEPAKEIMLQVLDSGKDVVTANKALIAEHGDELFARARELGRCIAFEAAVAGGIPIIANITQCLSANQIHSLQGILNGTSNFIVSQMEEEGQDYAAALKEAQELGYAEADPTMDVDGSDAAQKLAILAQLAFGAQVSWSQIACEGIEQLETVDMQCAAELGYRIKLLAVAELCNGELELHVSPTLVQKATPLAEVRGAFNAINVVGDAVGPVFFHGQGAGQMPTASAVAADLIDTIVGRAALTFSTQRLWAAERPQVPLCDASNVSSQYYFRFVVQDSPGVLAEIASKLGEHGVSIASMIQHASEEQTVEAIPVVSLVMMTHTTTAGAVDRAFDEIGQLDAIRGQSVRMRVYA